METCDMIKIIDKGVQDQKNRQRAPTENMQNRM